MGVKMKWFEKLNRWQANCCKVERQIVVALKRNDAYAQEHQRASAWLKARSI
jgi:hypothetical protein